MLRLFRELRSLWRSYNEFGVQARWLVPSTAVSPRGNALMPCANAVFAPRIQEFAALRRQRELMEEQVAQVRPEARTAQLRVALLQRQVDGKELK
jgi:hypothetical protein